MRLVDSDRIAPQLPVKLPGALARFQLFDERRPAAKRDINRACVFVDQMESLRHGTERHRAALNARLKRFDDAGLVQRFAAQAAQGVKIAAHRLRRAGVPVPCKRFPRRAHRRAEQERRQLGALKNRDDALLRRPLSLAVAAARRLQDGIEPRKLAIDRREVHVHARFDQRGGDHPAR